MAAVVVVEIYWEEQDDTVEKYNLRVVEDHAAWVTGILVRSDLLE
jgi:hypothetical protein